MNQRHIQDDDYLFKEPLIKNLKNNKNDSDGDTTRCVRTISIENNNLVGNLEEFGLSQYEARAYLTMIGKGSLSASEIAYYSHLPRTKIYLTLKKLEKK